MSIRKDDIINCGGIKIAPDEIEESVKKYKEIIDCACVPKEDKVTGQTPKVFVVVYNKEKFQKKELIKFLEKYIDNNKIPKDIVFLHFLLFHLEQFLFLHSL